MTAAAIWRCAKEAVLQDFCDVSESRRKGRLCYCSVNQLAPPRTGLVSS
jgi:hypothetical protein